jgi:hypothetical protein
LEKKMAIYLGNAFSLNMVVSFPVSISCVEVDASEVTKADFSSVVGHQDTANVFSDILHRDVRMVRATLKLELGDVLYVGQLSGNRLPEGATSLPDGAVIKWLKVEIK